MNPTTATALGTVFKKAGLKETAVLLALAWLIPFAIHLLPWSEARPLGAYLIPVFWTAFVAVYFYGAAVGLIVGLAGPVLNLVVTGLPAWRFLGVMSIELVIFVLVLTGAVRRAPQFFLLAPLGYLVAIAASTGLQAVTTLFGAIGQPGPHFLRSLAGSLAGLVVLTAINIALVRFYPKSPRGK